MLFIFDIYIVYVYFRLNLWNVVLFGHTLLQLKARTSCIVHTLLRLKRLLSLFSEPLC